MLSLQPRGTASTFWSWASPLLALALTALALWWRQLLGVLRGANMAAWRSALANDAEIRRLVMATIYLGVLTATLVGLGKNGAGIAYFDEWMGALSIFIGVLVAAIAAPAGSGGLLGRIRFSNAVKVALPLLLIVQTVALPADLNFDFHDEKRARDSDALVARIARAEKPVLSTDMVLLMLAGKGVPWEPAIFTELAAVGRWDESRIIRMIEAHDFAFVITRDKAYFSPAVSDAVNAAYPRVEPQAEHTLHLPPE